jgi:citrate lyase subunit beta/citryl-CoA lyase
MKYNKKIASAGNKGKGIRSDCFVTIELIENKGLDIQLESKVKVLYGDSIIALTKNILNFFNIKNAKVLIEDKGALDFIIAARIEAAVKQLIDTDKEYVYELIEENKYKTAKDRNRFTRLYLPGNTPSLMINAGIHKPDGVILDLEDAVAPDKKAEAQILVRNTLCRLNFYEAERMVRINQIPKGLYDLDYIIPYNTNLVLIPKCESSAQVHQVNEQIKKIKDKKNIKNSIWLMPIIESCLGVVKSYEIASAADNIVALVIGLEDYTADLGTKRTNHGDESFYARCQIVNSCKAAGIQAIDSVFSDISDMEALKENVLRSKALGFDGMGCIHPRQIKVVYENFAPDAQEIEKAKKIVNAFLEAKKMGLGVVSLGTKMIDPPIVKRAQKIIDMAINMNKLSKNWREENEEI